MNIKTHVQVTTKKIFHVRKMISLFNKAQFCFWDSGTDFGDALDFFHETSSKIILQRKLYGSNGQKLTKKEREKVINTFMVLQFLPHIIGPFGSRGADCSMVLSGL